MTHRSRRLVAAAAVTVLTSSLGVTAVGESAAQAKIGAPVYVERGWTKLSTGANINISTPPVVTRFGGHLVVGWNQGVGAINSRLIGSSGSVIGPIGSVVSGWYDIDDDPTVAVVGGKPVVAWSGARSDDSTDPYNDPIISAGSSNALSWMLNAGSLSQSPTGTGSSGIGLVDDGTGQPVTVYTAGDTDHLAIHHGVDPSVPAAVPDSTTGILGETLDMAVARDAKSGKVYATYYSALSGATQGVHGIEVYPAISGPSNAAPYSVYKYGGSRTSNDPGQNLAIAAPTGGGVWVAYAAGYYKTSALVLWNLETGRTLVMKRPTADIQYVTLSASVGGRLWVSWVQGTKVYATRTNPSVTKFGVVRVVSSPSIVGSAPTRTAGDGALGPLDLVINTIGKGDKDAKGNLLTEMYSARLLEGLAVAVSPARVAYTRGGVVTVTVTDAGVPVVGAAVKLGSTVKYTNSDGKVTYAIARHAAKGTHAISVTRAGWWPGKSAFRVV